MSQLARELHCVSDVDFRQDDRPRSAVDVAAEHSSPPACGVGVADCAFDVAAAGSVCRLSSSPPVLSRRLKIPLFKPLPLNNILPSDAGSLSRAAISFHFSILVNFTSALENLSMGLTCM